jgi:RimJ/RimL family protein N-acetyltransferase
MRDAMHPVRLETDRLVLRELRLEDWRDAQLADADPEVARFQAYGVLDEAGTRRYLERAVEAAHQTPRRTYDLAVCLAEDERFLGRVGLAIERPAHFEATVWINLRRDRWRSGLATEAGQALGDFAFDTLGLHRVYGDTDPRNTGSIAVLEKLGFRREAHFRENWLINGEWCDSYIYAVLAAEWRAQRKRDANVTTVG